MQVKMDWYISLTGFFWGAVSSVSLPLGAAIGLWLRPSRKVTSALMSFGGGALLFALTIELFGHVLHVASGPHGTVDKPVILIVAMVAALGGGLLFQLLNRILNNQGAFFRKGALLRKHINREKRGHARKLLKGLSRVKLLQCLPAEEVVKMIPLIQERAVTSGEMLFREGDEGDRLYFIVTGRVLISREESSADQETCISVLEDGDIFGEMSLVLNQRRNATATAETDVLVWEMSKGDFDQLLSYSPELQHEVKKLLDERIQDLTEKMDVPPDEAREWEKEALRHSDSIDLRATSADVIQATDHQEKKGNAAMAIWMGIALDGIPESIVIGILVVQASALGMNMSLAFIVGVFIANLPESMSSAITMQKTGMSVKKILLMWGSLCLLTAIGALLGTIIFPENPTGMWSYFIFAIEGLAAGAMLTMIAETMLPEAFEQGGGPIVGISTLAGFLAALAVKLIH
jgi:CRP-like cAMP-binding protein